MGFGANIIDKEKASYNDLIKQVTVKDLENFGMMPEFLGRLPVIAHLDELQVEDLEAILTKPKNAFIKQYKSLFRDDDVELKFTDEAVTEIAKKAYKMHTGARSLQGILESVLLKYMYDIPDDNQIKSILITKETVLSGAEPEFEFKTEDELEKEIEENNKNIC